MVASQLNYWQRRINRRWLLKGAVLSGASLAAAAVIDCAGEEKPPAPAPTLAVVQPKRSGALRYSTQATNPPYERGLDPHVNQASHAGRMRLFYQTLVRANPRTWEVEAELAQKWQIPSPTEMIFTLQPGVKWHNKAPVNGRDLRVDDVVFSLNRLRTPNPKFIVRSLLESVDKIEAVDNFRVKLTLKSVDAPLLDNLTGFSLAVIAPEVVEKYGDKFVDAETAVGTGAFVLTERTEVSATHLRSPNYWKAGLPYLDQVLMPAFGDEEAKWAAFQAGRIDLIPRLPGTTAKRYSAERGQFTIEGKFLAEWAASPSMQAVFINAGRSPFNDPRVYRALRLLINHEEAVRDDEEIVSGRGHHSQALPSALARWDFSQEEYTTRFLEWKQPKDDAARTAIGFLGAAGFTRDKPLTFTVISQSREEYQRRNALLLAQWRQLSQGVVQPDFKGHPSQVFDQIRARREHEVLQSGAAGASPEPDANLRAFYHSKGTRNYGNWKDAKADELIDRQRATLNLEQRKAIIKEVLLHMIENAPAVTWSGSYSLTAAQTKVKAWAPADDTWASAFQYESVWLDI